MKYIISESKIESAIRKYLDDNYYPDYGWSEHGYYKLEFDKYNGEYFNINDGTAYEIVKLRENHGNLLTVYKFEDLDAYFGNKWEPIFIEWFEGHTGLKVDNFRVNRREDNN